MNPVTNTGSGLIVPIPANSPDPMPIVPVDYPPPKPPIRNYRKKGVTSVPSVSESSKHFVNREADSLSGGQKVKLNYADMIEPKLCQTKGCSFFGSFENDSYCSKCFRESQLVVQARV